MTHCPTWLNATRSARAASHAIVVCHTLAAQVPVVAREAAAGLEVELPVVQAAREHAVVDLAEAREVGLAVRAVALDAPAVALEELVGAAPFAVALLDVVDAFGATAP